MPGKKQKKNYKCKSNKIFTGMRRQETERQSAAESVIAAENVVSPRKLSESEEKLDKLNCPLTETETNEVLTRS